MGKHSMVHDCSALSDNIIVIGATIKSFSQETLL